jgi:hypothetical protein
MSPALLINETSAPASPETAENTASPSPTSEPLTLDGPSPATTSRLNRRSPLLRRNVRTPALWLEEAEGSWLTVTDGVKKWKIFDASGGASVSNIGYKDSRVYAATRKQEDTGIQYAASMTFNTHAPYDFADLLLESTGDEMREVVFFGSGNAFRFLLLFVNDMLTTTRLRSPRSFPKAFIPVSFEVETESGTTAPLVHCTRSVLPWSNFWCSGAQRTQGPQRHV